MIGSYVQKISDNLPFKDPIENIQGRPGYLELSKVQIKAIQWKVSRGEYRGNLSCRPPTEDASAAPGQPATGWLFLMTPSP